MRFPVRPRRFGLATVLSLGVAALALASCVPGFGSRDADQEVSSVPATRSIATGPAADYPMVLGDPFTIDGITYTPADTLNYDEVGYATLDDPDAIGITASHRTLPLPSYVEVTSLGSGRTVVMRVERRGPMTNARLLGLSGEAMAQLGVSEGDPLRVRRVNPPEDERAELRADRSVAPRMETPSGLLDVLKRQLPAVGSVSLAAAGQPPAVPDRGIETIDPSGELAPSDRPSSASAPSPQQAPMPQPEPVPIATATASPAPPASVPVRPARGTLAVQAGAYSSRASADRVAQAIGGYVEQTGSLWRVRVGPFANRGEATAALAKVRGAGYRDAQIVTTR